jgi:capsular polysaccharide transport system permease protein
MRPMLRIKPWIVVSIALCPALMALVYYGFVASNIYVSEASFLLRSSNRTAITSGFAGFLKLVGISTSQEDTYVVHEFLTSRDALDRMSQDLDLRAMYGRSEIDGLARYPSIFYGDSEEDFTRYMKNRVTVHLNPTTGMSMLQVQAFTPEDARGIAVRLLELSEQTVNELNERIRKDAIRVAGEEVERAKERLQQAHLNITSFRNRELMINPNESSVLVMQLVASLSDQLTQIETEITQALANSPGGPQVVTLQRRAAALKDEIAQQRDRFTENSEGLARKIELFETLRLEQDVATKVLSSAILSLEDARNEAHRKQLYLERVAAPQLPDKAVEPRRLFNVVSIAALNLILLLVIWLMKTGIAEHAPGRKAFAT